MRLQLLVDPFSYLIVLVSIILGLGITRVLSGLGQQIEFRTHIQSYGPAVTWALVILVVHRPDLPLYSGDSPHVGLGLWHSVAGTLAVEAVLLMLGLALYLRATSFSP